MIVGVLIVAGLASLLVGVIVDQPIWVYAAVGLSLVALALIAFDWWRNRPVEESEKDADVTEQDAVQPAEDEAAEPAAEGAETSQPEEPAGTSAATEETPAATKEATEETAGDTLWLVRIVPGRRRYHAPGCAQLDGQETEEVTVEEAVGEGFSACTRCVDRSATPA
jgi:hypothetical protein